MTDCELKKMRLQIDDRIFLPQVEFSSYDTETRMYENLRIIKTAKEVYQDWLEAKENQDKTNNLPSTEEQIANLQDLIIELSNTLF